MSKVKCEICGEEFEQISNSHLKKHGITHKEYCERFPDAPLISEEMRKSISETLTGRTKENHEGVRRQSEKMTGRTKENHEGVRRMAEKKRGLTKENCKYLQHHSEKMKGRTKETHEYLNELSKYMKSKIGKDALNWKGGLSFEPYCEKFDEDLKERVREYFGRCCYICGMNEIDNGERLSVHHVNYDKMVCCNTVEPLFVPLCRSCHSKTHQDREEWEDFFTASLKYLTNSKCFYTKEEIGGET